MTVVIWSNQMDTRRSKILLFFYKDSSDTSQVSSNKNILHNVLYIQRLDSLSSSMFYDKIVE